MFNRKGQNIAEYSILIALVIAAAVGMQIYVKRGIQGRVADAVDFAPSVTLSNDIGTLNFTSKQYEPYYSESSALVNSDRSYSESINAYGSTTRNAITETTTRGSGAYDKTTGLNQYDRGTNSN